MKHGIVIAHGPLGAAFIEAAKSIMGTDEGLYPLSVTEMSAQEIHARLSSFVNNPPADVEGVVIMACLRGGSSWNVSAAVCNDKSHVRLVSGCNLAMILSFLTQRDALSLDELADKITQDAKTGVTTFHP